MDGGEEVVVALVLSGHDGAEVIEASEDSLNQVAIPIEEGTEGRNVLAVRHWLDIGPTAGSRHLFTLRIAIASAISQQDVACAYGCQHVLGTPPVMRRLGVSLMTIGKPLASTKTWILVVRLPRKRPVQPRPSIFGR